MAKKRMVTITVRQIAERTGLSKSTVSHILNNTKLPYNQNTRQRVIAAAQELGYRPNAFAKAMRRGRFNSFGLLLSPDLGKSRITEPMFHAIREAMRKLDRNLVVGDLPDEQLADPSQMPRILREWSVDGLLINYTHEFPETMVEIISQQQIPSVWINANLPTDCVRPDDYQGGYEAISRLLTAGHRRIAYVGSAHPQTHYSESMRDQGYRDAMSKAGLKPVTIHYPPGDEMITTRGVSCLMQELQGVMSASDAPTALVVNGFDSVGIAVLMAQRLSLWIPEDLSVVAINHEKVHFADHLFDTCMIDNHTIAQQSVDLLKKKERRPDPVPVIVVPFIWEPGSTIKPPR